MTRLRGGAATDSSRPERNRASCTIMDARIYQPAKPATQSGRFRDAAIAYCERLAPATR